MFARQTLPAVSQGLPYDVNSLMHFRPDAYAKYSGLITITPKRRDVSWKDTVLPTSYDYLHINLLYCGGKTITLAFKTLRMDIR